MKSFLHPMMHGYLFLADLNKYNIEGRYPDSYEELPDSTQANDIITTGGRIFQWLRDQL